MTKKSICLNCIYGSQPYGYYPIFCVHDVNCMKEMWYDKKRCKHFEQCPEPPEVPEVPEQEPWQIIITNP